MFFIEGDIPEQYPLHSHKFQSLIGNQSFPSYLALNYFYIYLKLTSFR